VSSKKNTTVGSRPTSNCLLAKQTPRPYLQIGGGRVGRGWPVGPRLSTSHGPPSASRLVASVTVKSYAAYVIHPSSSKEVQHRNPSAYNNHTHHIPSHSGERMCEGRVPVAPLKGHHRGYGLPSPIGYAAWVGERHSAKCLPWSAEGRIIPAKRGL
jgi:hypothetical protein